MYYSIYVGQLPIKTTKEDLLELFAVHGPKESVVLKKNGCDSSAFGFVRFTNPQAVIDVVKEGEWTLRGKMILVDVASETRSIMQNIMTCKQPSSHAVERDNMVRSKLKESCRQVNRELDIINGDVPLDARWVISQMEGCAVRYAAKLSGTPQPTSLLSHQDLCRYLEQSPCRSSKEPERGEGRAGRVMERVKATISGLHDFLELAQVREGELEAEALSLLGNEQLRESLPPKKHFLPRNVKVLTQTLGLPCKEYGEEVPGADQNGRVRDNGKRTVSDNKGGSSTPPASRASSSEVAVADRERKDLPEYLQRMLQLSVMSRVERGLHLLQDGQTPSSASLDKLKAFGGWVSSTEEPSSSSTEPGGGETFSLEKPVPSDPPGVPFSRGSCHSQQQQTSGGKGRSGKNFEPSPALTSRYGTGRSDKHFDPKSGTGRSDRHFEPKSGTGRSDRHFEPKSGTGRSDRHFDPKSGTGRSDRHLDPKSGTGRSDRHFDPKSGIGRSDRHFEPKSGTGRSDRHFEPKSGTGRSDRHFEPKSGTGRWDRHFEPKSGTGRWDENFGSKYGTGRLDENFGPSRELTPSSGRRSSDENCELSRVLSKISMISNGVQPHARTTHRDPDDGVSSLSLLQTQALPSRSAQSSGSDPGRQKRGVVFAAEKTVNGGAPFRSGHSRSGMVGKGMERTPLEVVGGQRDVKGPRFRLRLTEEEEEEVERENSRRRWEELEQSYVVPDRCKAALESEDATSQSLPDKEDIWEELGKANFRLLMRGGGMDEEEEVTDSYGRRTTSRRASKENGRRTTELGSSRPNGAVSSFGELQLLDGSGERNSHRFSNSKIQSSDSEVCVSPKGVFSPPALPVMGRGRGLVYSALMDNVQHNVAPSPRAPESRDRGGQRSPTMTQNGGDQSGDVPRATTPGLGRGRGRGLALLLSPS